MKLKIAQLLIGLVFVFGLLSSSAQQNRVGKNLKEKSQEESFITASDKTLSKLNKLIDGGSDILNSQTSKLVRTGKLINKTNSKIIENYRLILMYKKLLSNGDNSAATIRHHSDEIAKLSTKNGFLKKYLYEELQEADRLKSVTTNLQKKITKMKSPVKLMKKAGKVVKYIDAVGAGFGVTGEMAAWYEGSSSFKNVLLRAVSEGGKAAVSIGAGAIAGAATALTTLNPFATGGSSILASISAEESYEATFGKWFSRLMDREHRAIALSKFGADQKKLDKISLANRKKAIEENIKLLKEIEKSQNELKAFFEERNRLWAEFEEEAKLEEEKQLALEQEQVPLVIQTASKKKIKPGETVTISLETTGGLLPITYSGFINYTIQSGYDRYLVSYKWTADKSYEPGVYEFTVKAKSASGKVGSHTLAIEVIDPNPTPQAKPQATQNYKTDTDGERLYSASELNIKEIPGAEIRKMIYKVNGIYDAYCEPQSNIKTQKFNIQLGVSINNESKLGVAHLDAFYGSQTFPMTEKMKNNVKKRFKEKGYYKFGYSEDTPLEELPFPEMIDEPTYTIYFHTWARDRKFDPVTGRIWGETEGYWSSFDTYLNRKDFQEKGFLEAKLSNGVITGTIKFRVKTNIREDDYSFSFTAKQ